jgi:hypothetical protein
LFIVYLVVFGGFACLFPLAFYCLVLASWNSRRRPFLVSGPADFAGVLLATSGFLIAGGPLILATLHENSHRIAEYPNFFAAWSALAGLTWPWVLLWAGYFVLVVGGAACLLVRRRGVSVIYNIDPNDAQILVPEVISRLGVPLVSRGSGYFIDFADGPDSGHVFLDMTIVPIMRHVTLRWSPAFRHSRRRVEAEIVRLLTDIDAPANPAAGWFLTAATGLFSLLLVLLAMFVYQAWRLRG